MRNKEQLRKQIEDERRKLNSLLADSSTAEAVYAQSLVVDELLEQYMELTAMPC